MVAPEPTFGPYLRVARVVGLRFFVTRVAGSYDIITYRLQSIT